MGTLSALALFTFGLWAFRFLRSFWGREDYTLLTLRTVLDCGSICTEFCWLNFRRVPFRTPIRKAGAELRQREREREWEREREREREREEEEKNSNVGKSPTECRPSFLELPGWLTVSSKYSKYEMWREVMSSDVAEIQESLLPYWRSACSLSLIRSNQWKAYNDTLVSTVWFHFVATMILNKNLSTHA